MEVQGLLHNELNSLSFLYTLLNLIIYIAYY
jgi:hypothetical protein